MEAQAAGYGVELLKCSADAAYFIDTYATIDDAQGHGGGGGTMPFRLWPAQVRLLWALMARRLVIILKARQLGFTWTVCGWALWMCLFKPGQVGLFLSKGLLEANEMLRRVKVLYERLPGWLREQLPAYQKPPTVSHIEFTNGSRITSLAATETAGSSFTASFVVMDEAAKMKFPDEAYNSVKPTTDAGGILVILSSAFGAGNLFHRIWTKAVSGANDFLAIFVPWYERPGRPADFREKMEAEADDPDLVPQEYPATAGEAFRSSGSTRFLPAWCDAQEANLAVPLHPDLLSPALREIDSGLSVFRLPAGRPCVIGADPAEGLEHRDRSDAAVFDAATREELAAINGSWEPDEFAGLLAILSDAYDAPIVVERNNHGHAVLLGLRNRECSRVADGPDGMPGWYSSTKYKPLAVDAMARHLRDKTMIVRSRAALDEIRHYRKLGGGKTGAPRGMHDDRVMSRAVALGWLEVCGEAELVVPQAHGRGYSPLPTGDPISFGRGFRRLFGDNVN